METTNSNALMSYAGRLYTAYMAEAKSSFTELATPTWADFVCDPLNKVSVACWVAVARVAIKLENDARDEAL